MLKVMLPHGGYFHDVLYNIRTTDVSTITMTTGDMQVLPRGLQAAIYESLWRLPTAAVGGSCRLMLQL